MLGQELEELPSRRINSQAFQDCKAFFYGFVMRIKLSPSLFIPQTVINSGPCWQNSGLCITARLNRLCLIQCSIICVHAHAATNKLNTFKQVDILPPTSEANKITHVLLGLMVHSGTEASLLPWPISPLDKDQVEKPSYRKCPYTNCHLLILDAPINHLTLCTFRLFKWLFTEEMEIFVRLDSKTCLDFSQCELWLRKQARN